ncbi:MAG: hypothetical protein IJ894_02490 [Bacteroidales bacterium]|nr:hypothetical protein [Bacteroidales bacterium]MBR2199602.1 hypothetical protein [Bacteroidales bacterium]MBR3714117.1 hypothetical protein [Bacteroidales bacterium]MBR4272586.1 hypothetical protein [Bacteroidales bacterium]
MKRLFIIATALLLQVGVASAQNFTPGKSGVSGNNGYQQSQIVNSNTNVNVVSNASNANAADLKAAIAKCEQSPIVITNAFGNYKFGMTEKEFVKVTKAAIKAKQAKRNSIGNVEYEMSFADGRTYSLILANAAFFKDKLCGLDFVFERFDGGMSDIIMEEIMQGDRFQDMDQYAVPMGYVYLKDNLEVILSRGRLSYMNLSVVNQRAKENAERNHLSRDAF